jgi:hypothetical protein
MKRFAFLLIYGLMVLSSLSVIAQDSWKPEKIQAGFYTPQRVGYLWDTWLYYYKGIYYQFYLAGAPGKWDSFELMVSDDGVNWKEYGRVLEPRKGTTWMGTGHIIESPGFRNHPRWIMNYSEWFGDKQDIMFATSDDLFHWNKVNESYRFKQDVRWYKPDGRWDCIDCIRLNDTTFLGYFTADPVKERFDHEVCGFGFAESRDGISWKALPPVAGNISGELGGIQKIGNKYFITVSEGRIATSDKPEGPFLAQKKNPNMFGTGCDIYFPRFFHNPPLDKTLKKDGVLVNHFYTGKDTIFSAPLKAVEIDKEGILRLKWWSQNNLLKDKKIILTPDKASDISGRVQFFSEKFNTDDVGVVEARIRLNFDDPEKTPSGFYFDTGKDTGYVLLFTRKETVFGTMHKNGYCMKIMVRINRDLVFNEDATVRLVFKRDLMEAYLDDYLVMLKRVNWTGKLGIIKSSKVLTNINGWVHD